MMSAYANGLRKPENFDSHVRKFRVICVTHEIQTGPRADVALFLQKLAADRHLAMDFWAFVGKLSDREGGELNDDQILAVILEGITQGEISPEDADLKQAIEDLRAMLAGVDVHGYVQIEPEPFSRAEPDPLIHTEDKWPPAGPQKTSGTHQIPAPFASDSGTHRISNADILPQLDQTLHRLELTNLELKNHLDEIDKRMSRLEPNLEETAPLKPNPNESGGTAAGLRFARMEELAHKPGSSGRLVLEPIAAAPAEEPFARKTPLSAHVPLEDYEEHHGYGKAVLSLLLVLALAAAGFFGYRDREPLQQKLSSLVQELQNKIRPANSASPADTSVQQPEQAQTRPAQPLEGTSTPPPVSPVTRNATTQAAVPARASQKQQEQPDSNRKSIADRIAAQAAQTSPDGISNADLAGALRVSPAVMESRLVDSRVPAYPDSAKLAGVEGSVIMQAIISRNGTVKRVHVLQGDSRLRGPATDAVYKWRYRPYLLDGQPVDVATTITVDFDLDR
jgi:TonB family protein